MKELLSILGKQSIFIIPVDQKEIAFFKEYGEKKSLSNQRFVLLEHSETNRTG
ncbi:hypothetical protein MHH81_04285 [Psychrobacillus sp. FSL H8-0484]|uniref:hypothetical protein n=1 Tax=Psychrobacillus sp. FSL H8-0484 TaxID=2921390 RepID=UPI0030F8C853